MHFIPNVTPPSITCIFVVSAISAVEVSRGKSTDSSSVYGSYASKKAVDGDRFSISGFFRSTSSAEQWLRVDLGENYFIDRIRVYNFYSSRKILLNCSLG